MVDIILPLLKTGAGIDDTTVYDEQLKVLIMSTQSRFKIEGIDEVAEDDPLFPIYVEAMRFTIIPLIKENYKYSEDYRKNLQAIKNTLRASQIVN